MVDLHPGAELLGAGVAGPRWRLGFEGGGAVVAGKPFGAVVLVAAAAIVGAIVTIARIMRAAALDRRGATAARTAALAAA